MWSMPKNLQCFTRLIDATDAYVDLITDKVICVRIVREGRKEELFAIGFSPDSRPQDRVSLEFENRAHLHGIMTQLRDMGLPFSAGPGWPPSDLFQHWRDQGMLHGPFKEILWRGPDKVEIHEL